MASGDPTGANGTPELMRAIGAALFGTRWQSDLADELGINRRTVRRWLSGEDEPRPGVWIELETLLGERAALQRELRAAIRARAARYVTDE